MKRIIVLLSALMLIIAGSAFAGNPVKVETTSTAVAQQQQGQVQVSHGGGGGSVNNSGNSGVTFKDSFNGAKPIRYLPTPSDITYTGMAPQMFSRPSTDKGPNFISANNLIGMMGAWYVEDLADDDFTLKDAKIDITKVRGSSLSQMERDSIERIDFAVQGSETQQVWKTNERRVVAIGTIYTKEKDVNSAELFMALAIKAREHGANAVVLMGEGVTVDLSSFGWGIGFSYNMAKVNSDPDGEGSVGAGGTGISGGRASYSKMPYLTFAVLQ